MCVFQPKTGRIWPQLKSGELIANKKSHKPFHTTRKSLTLDNLEKSLGTLLCQSCAIVAER